VLPDGSVPGDARATTTAAPRTAGAGPDPSTGEDFAASRAKGANLAGINAFFDAIHELVSAEEGENADGGLP
jgi:hypothetical protein